jgi:hypothetical protein
MIAARSDSMKTVNLADAPILPRPLSPRRPPDKIVARAVKAEDYTVSNLYY